jgi:flagellar motor switch protein FliM
MMLSGVDRLGEKLGRRLRALLEPMVGGKPKVVARPVELIDFGTWSGQVPAFSSIGVYRLLPLKGNVLLRMDAGLVSTAVDCFYGGTGRRMAHARAEFTSIEDRLIASLSDALMKRLVECWADTLPLEAALIARETGVGFAASQPASDQMVVQRFTVSLVGDDEWPIDILYPLAGLRAIEPLLGTKVHDEADRDDPVWRARIARQMGNIRLPARTVLARPSLPLADLMKLKAGDIIPVNLNRILPLIVGDRIVAHGSIGEQDGRAAFLIETLAQGNNQ